MASEIFGLALLFTINFFRRIAMIIISMQKYKINVLWAQIESLLI